MEFLIFIGIVVVFILFNPKVQEIIDTNLDTANELAKKHNAEIKEDSISDFDILDDTTSNDTTINNYTQNNIYVQNNYYKKKKKKTYSKTYLVHTSESGLADKLLSRTGSKRVAKDILVDQYGYSQNEAKSLVGYRGY